MILKNASIILETEILNNTDIKINEGLITGLGKFEDDVYIIDLEGMYVSPGFIDIHTHGGYGGDFMDAEDESFDKALSFHSDNGTTSLLATSVTAPVEQIEKMLSKTREYMKKENVKCSVLGAHIEGPYLSEKNKGAQHISYLRVPSRDSYEFILNNADVIKTVTIAPELDGATQMAQELKKQGIVVCGGHDNGEKEDIIPVVEAGLSHCTHLWCAMSAAVVKDNIRRPGLLELGLSDERLTVEIIADNHHISPEMAKIVHKCKGKDKMCIVSDSLRAGGMPDDGKEYLLGSKYDNEAQKFVVAEGVAALPDRSRLAGSIQPLNRMIKNLVFDANIPLCDSVCSATINPAKVIGMEDKIGSIAVGKIADLCIMDKNLDVRMVIKNGRIIKGDIE